MKKLILGFIVLISLFFSVSSTFACSCLRPESPQEELKKSSFVFVGKVIGISSEQKTGSDTKKVSHPKTINFTVSQNFKGVNGKTITLKTADNSAMCGYNFEKGKEYLVYTNKYDVYSCSRTALAENNKDIEVLTKNAKKVYDTKAKFEKAEGNTCRSATDGCNNYIMKDGKVFAGTQMYCEDIYGKNGQEKWSCKEEKQSSKEEFIKKYGKTCETATDGVNTFFGKDFSASTRIGYPENFVADWTCKKEKEIKICTMEYAPVCGENGVTYGNSCMADGAKIAYKGECKKSKLSQSDANNLKKLEKTLDTSMKTIIDNFIKKYNTKLQNLKNPQKVNVEAIKKVEKVIGDFLKQYPKNKPLPKKAQAIYDALSYLKLSLMNINV